MGKVISIVNQKGGVAKTTTTFNLATALAAQGHNVLMVDLDPQASLTISTGISVNHMISVVIALFGGWIWSKLGIETLFILSAVLGLCNSAYAATIKSVKKSAL